MGESVGHRALVGGVGETVQRASIGPVIDSGVDPLQCLRVPTPEPPEVSEPRLPAGVLSCVADRDRGMLYRVPERDRDLPRSGRARDSRTGDP